MFKKLKMNANFFILLYDAVSSTCKLLSDVYLIITFIFFIGIFYDLSINPIYEVDYFVNELYVVFGFSAAVIFWFIHKIMCLLRLKFVNKITSIFPVRMMITERVKK